MDPNSSSYQSKIQGSYSQSYRAFSATSPVQAESGEDGSNGGAGISVLTAAPNESSASPARRFSSRRPSLLDRQPVDQDFGSAIPATVESSVVIPSASSTTSSKNAIFFEDFNAHSIYQQAKSIAVSPATQEPSPTINLPSPAVLPNRRPSSSVNMRTFQPLDSRWSAPVFASNSASDAVKSLEDSGIPEASSFSPTLPPPTIDDIRQILNDGLKLYHVPIAKNILGEGRYAVVYKGSFYSIVEGPVSPTFFSRQESNQSAVCAVKCLHVRDSEAQNNGIVEAHIINELQSWNQSRGHDNIVKLITADQDSEDTNTLSLLLGLEFCSLGQLSEFIKKNTRFCGRRRFISWSKQLASAVAFLHRGRDYGVTRTAIIHHDIKPHNVLLDSRMILKLADFGSATLVKMPVTATSPPIFRDGLGLGTQTYSPPEILEPPNFAYSFYTDIYSLGCTFYYLLTGREPFANLRNPSHQLWCIRRGFWESGANPLVPLRQSDSASSNLNEMSEARTSIAASLSLQPSYGEARLETHSVAASPMPLPLVQFLNGETLHTDIRRDSEAYFRIVSLLKKCTAVKHSDRPSADAVVKDLELIDDVLILGTGFDEIEQHDSQFSSLSERMTSSTVTETEISALSTASAPANMQPNINNDNQIYDQDAFRYNFKNVQGGRKSRYL